MSIIAAADGSALGNPGPAGWAWYVDDGCWAAGGWKHATNNQGELKAVLELFRATAHTDEDLIVMCDSQYVINSLTKWMRGWKAKGWRKADGKPVMNVELLRELDAAMAGRHYRFEWVKGHFGHELNEAADLRARAVAEAYQASREIPTGPGWTRDGASARAPSTAGQRATVAAEPPKNADPENAGSKHAPEPLSLFDLDEPNDAEPTGDQPNNAEQHTLTLSLSSEEHARLRQRARKQGMTAEQLLRSLI